MFRLRNPDAQSELVCLPDDVLISILEQLDLTTQLKMTHVHIRFLTLMPQIWRSQCRTMTLSLIELHLSDKDLRFFLGSNQKTFQVLRLKMERRGNFDILTQFVFPEVHNFRFSMAAFWLRDSDLPRIKKLNASGTDVFFFFQNPAAQIEILKVATYGSDPVFIYFDEKLNGFLNT